MIKAKDVALVPMRISLGATMLYHGLPKLRAEGARQTGAMLEGMGFKRGERWARATGAAEVFGGLSALLGIGTRLGALAVLATQAVAISKVHAPKGFSNMAGGWEFNLALTAMALGFLVAGPGHVSVHEVLEHRLQRRGRLARSPLARRALAANGLGRWLALPRSSRALAAVKAIK